MISSKLKGSACTLQVIAPGVVVEKTLAVRTAQGSFCTQRAGVWIRLNALRQTMATGDSALWWVHGCIKIRGHGRVLIILVSSTLLRKHLLVKLGAQDGWPNRFNEMHPAPSPLASQTLRTAAMLPVIIRAATPGRRLVGCWRMERLQQQDRVERIGQVQETSGRLPQRKQVISPVFAATHWSPEPRISRSSNKGFARSLLRGKRHNKKLCMGEMTCPFLC